MFLRFCIYFPLTPEHMFDTMLTEQITMSPAAALPVPAGMPEYRKIDRMSRETFGQFLARKRQEKKISLRGLATQLGISAPFLSDVEKDRKTPFNNERIEQVARILNLSEEEKTVMLDLAGQSKKSVIAPDLPEYINEHDYVKAALRTARDMGAGEEEWQRFIDDLKRRKG